jgi:hypothetical protein
MESMRSLSLTSKICSLVTRMSAGARVAESAGRRSSRSKEWHIAKLVARRPREAVTRAGGVDGLGVTVATSSTWPRGWWMTPPGALGLDGRQAARQPSGEGRPASRIGDHETHGPQGVGQAGGVRHAALNPGNEMPGQPGSGHPAYRGPAASEVHDVGADGQRRTISRAVMACPFFEAKAVYSVSATSASEIQRPTWSSQMARG